MCPLELGAFFSDDLLSAFTLYFFFLMLCVDLNSIFSGKHTNSFNRYPLSSYRVTSTVLGPKDKEPTTETSA